MADRISQEFYCGNCVGYFLVRLNMALNYEVEMVCPNCGHEHRRCIKNGVIYEEGRFQSQNAKEKIRVPKSSYRKEPYTEKMRNSRKRDGVPVAQEFLHELWVNKADKERQQV